MMRIKGTLKLRFISIFIISILIPNIISMYIFLFFYENQMVLEKNTLINNNLSSIAFNISQYLIDIDNLASIACFDNSVSASSKDSPNITYSPNLLNLLESSRKDILSLIIINKNKSIIYSNVNQNVQLIKSFPFYNQTWYKNVINNNTATIYIGIHKPTYFTYSSNTDVFSIVKSIKNPYDEEVSGVIIADTDARIFKTALGNLNLNNDSVGLILDEKGNILYSTNSITEYKLNKINNGYTYLKEDGNNYNIISKNIVPSYWKLVVIISDKELKSKVRLFYFYGMMLTLTGLVIMYIIYYFSSKNIISSFHNMVSVMKDVEKGNLKVKCPVSGNDEISILETTLNNMIERLDVTITKEYRLALEQQNANFNALQSQINPHFLYNTLNGFIGLNRLGERDSLEKAIFNLTKMLRYILEYKNSTTIGNEFEFIKEYCSLQKIRFSDRINVNVNYSEDIKDFKIPKLLVQPLVENSIIYGLEPLDRMCTITVNCLKITEEEFSYVMITIDDDGMGFDENELKNKLTNKSSIGINNIIERLNFVYPGSYFSIKSEIMKGTHVLIKIKIEDGL